MRLLTITLTLLATAITLPVAEVAAQDAVENVAKDLEENAPEAEDKDGVLTLHSTLT